MKKIILLLLLLLLINSVSGHQPRIVNSENIEVLDPEISKAYYGKLNGEPHLYTINADEEFAIYVNVLIPGKEKTHTISAKLLKDDEVIYFLDGENFQWEPWYEEFGKDWYMKGPEYGKDFKSTENLPVGKYQIKVFNNENEGKYVLAVGDIESFPPSEIAKAVLNVPRLKVGFFGKYYLLGILFILIILILYLSKILPKFIKK